MCVLIGGLQFRKTVNFMGEREGYGNEKHLIRSPYSQYYNDLLRDVLWRCPLAIILGDNVAGYYAIYNYSNYIYFGSFTEPDANSIIC